MRVHLVWGGGVNVSVFVCVGGVSERIRLWW